MRNNHLTHLALFKNRVMGVAACAVDFLAWGEMCRRLLEALGNTGLFRYSGINNAGLAFVKFFAMPIDTLNEMAASIINK